MTRRQPSYGTVAAALLTAASMAGCAHYNARPLAAQRSAASFTGRTLADARLRAFMEERVGHPIAPWPPKAWTFEQLTLAALYYHPKLALARAQWASARAKAVTAGAYPNPTLRLDPFPQYTTNSAPGVSPWTIGLAVAMPILTAGKRSYRIAQALAEAEAARFDVVQTAWQIRAGLRAPLIKLYAAQHRLKLLSAHVRDAGSLVDALIQRMKAGQVSEFQVVQARLRWNQARLQRADAETAQSQARAAVAGALGMPVSALTGISFDFAALRRLPPVSAMPRARFETWALTRRPDIRASLMRYAATEQGLKLQIANQYPDLRIGPGYTWDQGDHRWAVGISLSLPVLNRNQGPIAEARAQREQAAAQFRVLQAQISNRLDSALAGYRTSEHKLHLARQLLEAGQSRLSAARAAYQAGEKSRVDLLRIRLETQRDNLAVLDARVQAIQALGALEDVLEHPLDQADADASHAIDDTAAPAPAGPHTKPERKTLQ